MYCQLITLIMTGALFLALAVLCVVGYIKGYTTPVVVIFPFMICICLSMIFFQESYFFYKKNRRVNNQVDEHEYEQNHERENDQELQVIQREHQQERQSQDICYLPKYSFIEIPPPLYTT